MATTYGTIIARAEQLALVGKDGLQSNEIDSSLTAEAVFPVALSSVLRSAARAGENLDELMTSFTLTVTSGAATLDPSVIVEGLRYFQFPARPNVSIVSPQDFNRARNFSQLDYFAVSGSDVLYSQAGVATFTGSLAIKAPAIPALPSPITNPFSLANKFVERVVTLIASVLKGEIPLAELMKTA